LTLNGEVDLGSTSGNTYGQLTFAQGSQTLGGTGKVVFGGSTSNALYTDGGTSTTNPMVLTIGSNITVQGGSGIITKDTSYYTDSIVFLGKMAAGTSADTITLGNGGNGNTVNGFKAITAFNGGAVDVAESLQINGAAIVSISPNSSLSVGGNILGDTSTVAAFQPQGTVTLNGAGTLAAPTLLEAMSDDEGSVAAGFNNNFAYGTLVIGSNNYVRLVNQSDNSPDGAAEAVYANSLIVSPGSTLDLNGLHLYVRDLQQVGTVVGGTITQIPDSGPLTVNDPTPGSISAPGELDNWTFFGRAGDSVSVVVDPGSGLPGAPVAPTLGWAQVQLLDAAHHVLTMTSNTTVGGVVTLSGLTLPADGTYEIDVSAAPGHPASTGNYVVTAWESTPTIQSLNVNQVTTGTLSTPFSVDQWTFSSAANTQVQFNLLAASATGLSFKLTGPNGFVGFTNLNGNSPLVTLPTAGTYTLTALGTGGATGSFAFEMAQTSLTPLTLGVPYQAALAGSGQAQLYQITVNTAGPLELSVTDPNSQDQNEIYVSYQQAPTRDTYDDRFTGSPGPNHTVVLSAQPGTYDILVYNNLAQSAGNYTIEAQSAPFILNSVAPQKIGNAHDTTLLLTGVFPLGTAGGGYALTTAPTVQFIGSNGTVFPAPPIALVPPPYGTVGGSTGGVNPDGTMTVSFVVPGGVLLPDTYSLRVTDNSGYSQTLSNVLNVVEGGLGVLKTNVIVPNPIGYHVASTIYVQYSNVGDAPLPAPLLVLTATQNGVAGALMTLDQSKVVSGFWTSATPDGYGQSVQFLASGAVPGILEPGESVTVPVYYAGWLTGQWDFSRPPIDFSLGVLDNTNTQAIDWTSLKSSLQPSTISDTAWNAIYPNLTAQLGSTWGQYVSRLDADAQYLGGLGEDVTDLGQLFNFEVQQANGYSPLATLASATDAQVAAPGIPLTFARTFAPGILQRNQSGIFGWGWSSSWDTSFTVDPDGSVDVLGPDGSLRRFQPDSRGGYFDQPGDHGILAALPGGGYTLTELDGQITAYNANGTLNYIQDSNGNRITASYTGGLLTKLTSSGGQFLSLAYNSAGLVSSITDSAVRTTTYHYDPSSQYLTSVVDFDGQTTSYTYDTSSNAATAHALLSVTHSDGTHDYFSYDATGKLIDAHHDGGTEDTIFAYSMGEVSLTDTFADTTKYSFDNRGLLVQVTNPIDATNHYNYDSDLNLVSTVDAAGQTYSNTYDAEGDLLSSTDPLGNTVSYTYLCADDRLASVTDADGNMTTYAYDGNGNLTSTTYADGTVESVAYDPIGNVISSIDRKGQATGYTYDAAGNVLTESFADGSHIAFTYDAHENLTSATDSTGTTTLAYDANDRLTKITYPSGRFLEYSYDTAGRRTQMVDETGYTVNFSYNAQGNLSTLTDGSSNLIVHYTYDAAGRLSREDHGNGTYVTYSYDAAGDLLDLVNYAPDGSVNSRFDYSYDSLGRRITEGTVDGNWTYSYDAIGELTHAVFVSTNPSVVNQDLAYVYDAAGNRTETIINGVTTNYTVNNLNEYTQVGDTAYMYDADGNMISTTDPTGTTTYAYNAQNQLSGVTGASGTWAYQYDTFGNRIASTQNGQTTQYLIDPSGLGDVVATFTGSGALMAHYTYGLGLVNQVAGGATSYYDFDAIGSTAGMTNTAGTYANKYTYLPFGQTQNSTSTVANPFQFVGQLGVLEDTDNVSYMRSRYYTDGTGKFLSADLLGIVGGDLNQSRYVGNDPVTFVDPTGAIGTLYNPNLYDLINFFSDNAKAFVIGSAGGLGVTAIQAIRGAGPLWPELLAYNVDIGILTVRVGLKAAGVVGTIGDASWEFLGYEQEVISSLTPNQLDAIADAVVDGSNYFLDNFPLSSSVLDSLANEIRSLYDSASLVIIQVVNSTDPNSKTGPSGYGTQNFVADTSPLPYQVNFENAPTASAPAQEVTITDQLDPNLDWSTFQWTGFGFGDNVIKVPADTQHYQSTLPMTYNGVTFRVVVTLDLNPATGQVNASFQSLNATNLMAGLAVCPGTLPLGPPNPDADLPPDVLSGFLPPEDGTGRGMGYITYAVKPKSGVVTGTQISNVADVTFDQGQTIATDQVSETDPSQGIDPAKEASVTIDSVAPTSIVAGLPATLQGTSFTVNWSGRDEVGGSGLQGYNIWVSVDGSQYSEWESDIIGTSAAYHALAGTHTYAFYSQAIDNVGNVEAPHATADATITVTTPPPVVTDVLVDGASWSSSFLSYLRSSGQGNGAGYAIPVGTSAQLTTLPWTGLNQIQIVFNENVNLHESSLALYGVNASQYSFSDFSYNATTFTATWTLATPLKADKILLDLNGHNTAGVTDAGGSLLDGEWTNGTSTYPSGDGTAGGDFLFRVNVLPGDVDANNGINMGDYLQTQSKLAPSTTSPNYNVRFDLDGSGAVTTSDALAARGLVGTILPTANPAPPAQSFVRTLVADMIVADLMRVDQPSVGPLSSLSNDVFQELSPVIAISASSKTSNFDLSAGVAPVVGPVATTTTNSVALTPAVSALQVAKLLVTPTPASRQAAMAAAVDVVLELDLASELSWLSELSHELASTQTTKAANKS
ncbi:MAG TPA: RHS repeat-associated core domain-containing protein, partial [Lacipirellulaceae bacterium]